MLTYEEASEERPLVVVVIALVAEDEECEASSSSIEFPPVLDAIAPCDFVASLSWTLSGDFSNHACFLLMNDAKNTGEGSAPNTV